MSPLNFQYFVPVFKEQVKRKIDDSHGIPTRLLKYTSGKVRQLAKNCIHLPSDRDYNQAIDLPQKGCQYLHRIVRTRRFTQFAKRFLELP